MKLYKYKPDERFQVTVTGQGEKRYNFYVNDTTLDELAGFVMEVFKDYQHETKITRTVIVEIRRFSEEKTVKRSKRFYGIKTEDAYKLLFEKVSQKSEEDEFVIGDFSCHFDKEEHTYKISKFGHHVASFSSKNVAVWFMNEKMDEV